MSGSRSSLVRVTVISVAGLLPIIAVLVGFIATSGGSAANVEQFRPAELATPSPGRPGITTAARPASGLPGGSGALVAVLEARTAMRTSPGGHRFATLGPHTHFGSPTVLWVVDSSGPWLGVVSALAGNGKLGWIPRTSAGLARVNWELSLSLAARRLTVLNGGHVVKRYTVAVGRPDAPTPTGRFSVTDRLLTGDPQGPYGCCILALSALAPHAIQGWGGGNRIAIHSTPETSTIGEPVSHGCVRLTLAEGKWLVDHVPLGTPTLIHA